VRFLANGLHGGVAKTLEKVTVLVSDDGLAWIGRTRCSLAAVCADLGCRLLFCCGWMVLDLLVCRTSPPAIGVQEGGPACCGCRGTAGELCSRE